MCVSALGLHCGQKKQSCSPLNIWLHLPATSLLGTSIWDGRRIGFYLPEEFSFSGFWLSTGSAGQSGTVSNLARTGTYTWQCVAGRKQT